MRKPGLDPFGCAVGKEPSHQCRGQEGQALVLGLLAVGAAGIMMVMVYNVGQVALARSRLTQATDAAAYTASLVQARTLNMLAHVQRTQVGHQVAVAHLVTLGAWAQFADAQHGNHRVGNPPGMIIGRFFGPQHRRAYGQSGSLSSGTRSALERAVKGHDSTAHVLLARVARQLVEALPATRAAAINQVLAANLPNHKIADQGAKQSAGKASVMQAGTQRDQAGPAIHWKIGHDNWSALLTRRTSGSFSGAGPLGDMVRRAVTPYGFLGKRDHSAYNPWSIHPACPWMLHTLQRRGATWLDNTGRWQAVDTQSFQARRFNRYIGCYYREYAMGWGAVRGSPAQSGGSSDRDLPDLSKEAYWRWARRATRWDLRLAENRVAGLRAMMRAWAPAQRGLAPWFDISARRDLTAAFELDVSQTSSSISTSDQPGSRFGPIGRFGFQGMGDTQMHVRATGQTYFSPDRSGQGASLFRPHWRARLAPAQRESGQALVESMLAMVLLLTLASASLWIGMHFQKHIDDDQTSRWLAFTETPGASGTSYGADHAGIKLASGAARSSKPDRARGVTARAALVARAQPGGSNRDAAEMRDAWRYADRGLVYAQVGARVTAVARDAGHHDDHRATQSRLAQSKRAWQQAADPSRSVARKIEAQAARSDAGWMRDSLSLDWLTPWAQQDIRRGRRERRGPRRRYPDARVLSRTRARNTCRVALAAVMFCVCGSAAARPCPVPGVTQVDTAYPLRALWQESAQDIVAMQQALVSALGETATHAAEGFFWLGIPVAAQRFSIDLRGRNASVSDLLRAAQPALTDMAVIDDRFMLAGHAGDMHWLAQWEESETHALGSMSVMRPSLPVFDVVPPGWLGSDARVVTHLVYPDARAPIATKGQLRIVDQKSPSSSGWSSASVWRTGTNVETLTRQMTQALMRQGWVQATDAASALLPTMLAWHKGACTIGLQVLPAVSGDSGTQVWIHSSGRAS